MSLLSVHPFPIFMRDLPNKNLTYQFLESLETHKQINPNIWLYAIWFALSEQGRLRRPEFKKLQTILHPWHERIYEALQQLADSLNAARSWQQWVLVETEMANQFEQQMLGQALAFSKKARRNSNQQLLDASYNLAAYYKIMRIFVNENIFSKTLEILRLFFVEATDTQIKENFERALSAARLDDSGFTQLPLI